MKKIIQLLVLAFALSVSAAAFAEPVNINTADAATLAATIKGIGLKKAEAIVAYRQANGPFVHVDDLANVKGIVAKTVDRPHFGFITGSGNDILYHTRQRDDLCLRKGVLQHLQAEMVVGMKVRHIYVGQVLTHRDNIGNHPVGIAEKLGSIDQDGILLSVNQGGVAVKTQVTV